MKFKMDLEDVTKTEYAEAEAWQTAVEDMAGVVSLPWKHKATDVHQCAQAKVEALRAFLCYVAGAGLPDYLEVGLPKPKTQAVGAGSDIESELPPGVFVARPGEKVPIGDLAPGEIKERIVALEGFDEAGKPVTEEIDIGDFDADEPPAEVPALSVELANVTLQGIDEAGGPGIDVAEDGCFKDAVVPAGTTEKIDIPGTEIEGEPDGDSKEDGLREVPETE